MGLPWTKTRIFYRIGRTIRKLYYGHEKSSRTRYKKVEL